MSSVKILIAPVLLIVISLLSVWSSVAHFRTGIVEEYDGILIVWILNQTIQKIPSELTNIFQSNIFFPFDNSFAFTVLMIPSAILAYFPVKLTGSYVAASNFTLIFGQIATALTTYYWLKDYSGNKITSFIASVALILSKIRLHYFVHLQMWTMHWWITPSYLFWKYFQSNNLKYLYFAYILMGIVIWENVLPLYFVSVILASLILINFSIFKKNIKHFIFGGVLSLLIMLPVLIAYRDVSITHGFERTIRDAAHFSAGIDDLSDKFFSPSLFLLFGLTLYKLGKDKRVLNKHTKWIFLVFIISFLFTFGPVLKWDGQTVKLFGRLPIPLPYSVFYYIVPGLNALRTTSRWILLSAFSAVVLFSYAFGQLSLKKDKILIGSLILVSIIGFNRLGNVYFVPDKNNIPDVYQWLSNTEYNSILELPMYTWTDGYLRKNDFSRMYYSLFHKKHLIGGVSGFSPKKTDELMAFTRNADSIDQIAGELVLFDPHLIILHQDEQFSLNGKTLDYRSFEDEAIWNDENTIVIRLKKP